MRNFQAAEKNAAITLHSMYPAAYAV